MKGMSSSHVSTLAICVSVRGTTQVASGPVKGSTSCWCGMRELAELALAVDHRCDITSGEDFVHAAEEDMVIADMHHIADIGSEPGRSLTNDWQIITVAEGPRKLWVAPASKMQCQILSALRQNGNREF